jgi:hypothetical protein
LPTANTKLQVKKKPTWHEKMSKQILKKLPENLMMTNHFKRQEHTDPKLET